MPSRLKVLVVDDDRGLLELLRSFVERESRHRFRFESDPLVASTVLRSERVDVLVTGDTLPGLSGCELADRARALRPGIRVVMISREQPQAGRRPFGADWLLTKPFYLPDLLPLVDAE